VAPEKIPLLRVLSGLWETEEGTIIRPFATGKRGLFFLPQRLYTMVGGTLKDQVIYPDLQSSASDAELLELMQFVGLGDVVTRIGLFRPRDDWELELSRGEMQRLGFARILYTKPSICVVDEATSFLDTDTTDRLITHLREKLGVSFITMSHLPSLQKHRTILLNFQTEDGQLQPQFHPLEKKTSQKFTGTV